MPQDSESFTENNERLKVQASTNASSSFRSNDDHIIRKRMLDLSPSTKDFLAGGIAGVASVVGGAPLDILRIRLQQPNSARLSLRQGLHGIVATEGLRALFRGTASPLASVAVQNAVTFQAYGFCERLLNPHSRRDEDLSTFTTVFLPGCFSGVAQSFIVTPVDLLKIRLQVGGAALRGGPLNLIKEIVWKDGPKGMFRGLPITFLRDTPSHGVYFWIYDYSQKSLDPKNNPSSYIPTSMISSFISGGLAGIVSWWSVYPLDVVKSRIQACQAPQRGWRVVMAECIRKEGWKSLFRGIEATTVRAFIVNGTIFSVYEAVIYGLEAMQ